MGDPEEGRRVKVEVEAGQRQITSWESSAPSQSSITLLKFDFSTKLCWGGGDPKNILVSLDEIDEELMFFWFFWFFFF